MGWAILCFIIAAIAIEDGEPLMICVFGGLGIWLTYRRLTRNERRAKQAKANADGREAQLKKRAQTRFANSTFAAMVIRDLQYHNWDALNDSNGCQILTDKIVMPHRTYIYLDYGLAKLDQAGCKELATYLGSIYPGEYDISEISHVVGGWSNSYTSYVTSDGSLSTSRDSNFDDVIDGYRLRKKVIKPAVPQGKKW